MGTAISSDDSRDQNVPHCDEHYLHWLLSDTGRVGDAFRPVWQACCANEQGAAKKSTVFEVVQCVVAEFEKGARLEDKGNMELVSQMKPQLARVVAMLPDMLNKTEAHQLFRTVLLSLQSALVSRLSMGQPLHWPMPGKGQLIDGVEADSEMPPEMRTCALSPRGAAPFAGPLPSLGPYPATKAEDLSLAAIVRLKRRRPGAFVPFLRLATLPSHHELEMENQELGSLAEQLKESTEQELIALQELHAEVSASQESTAATTPTFSEKRRDDELAVREAEVGEQQREIQALRAVRAEEEVTADTYSREAREFAMQLKNCRYTCGSLESEIASEEARTAALRDAFEGRRHKYTTAQAAARNAEENTMRAARRRTAAEEAARREADAVELAEAARESTASSSYAHIEMLTSEIAHLRMQLEDEDCVKNQPSWLSSTMPHRDFARLTLERNREVSIAQTLANEVSELEATQTHLEMQLSGHGQPTAFRSQDESTTNAARGRTRQMSTELWEARAQLMLQQAAQLMQQPAEQSAPDSEGVVGTLRALLENAEVNAARTSVELAEVRRQNIEGGAVNPPLLISASQGVPNRMNTTITRSQQPLMASLCSAVSTAPQSGDSAWQSGLLLPSSQLSLPSSQLNLPSSQLSLPSSQLNLGLQAQRAQRQPPLCPAYQSSLSMWGLPRHSGAA